MNALTLALLAAFQIIRPTATLATTPGDDMRPQIVGDVVAVDASQVTLDGGAFVPVMGARVRPGDHATFACDAIDMTRETPQMRGCVLMHVDKPAAKDDGKLW